MKTKAINYLKLYQEKYTSLTKIILEINFNLYNLFLVKNKIKF